MVRLFFFSYVGDGRTGRIAKGGVGAHKVGRNKKKRAERRTAWCIARRVLGFLTWMIASEAAWLTEALIRKCQHVHVPRF